MTDPVRPWTRSFGPTLRRVLRQPLGWYLAVSSALLAAYLLTPGDYPLAGFIFTGQSGKGRGKK